LDASAVAARASVPRRAEARRKRRVGIGYGALRSVRTLEQRTSGEVVRVCVTGATGFIGAHVTKLAAEADGPPRVTYRDEARLDRLGDVEVEPIKADVLDRAALRRAFRGCEVVFHA